MANKHLLDQPIPPTGLPLEGGIILFPYDPKHDSDFHPRTLDEILKHRYQISGVPYGYQIDPDGFLADVMRCMPTTLRQFGVYQLQRLDTYYIDPSVPRIPGPHDFSHVRGTHALDCAAATAIICNTHGIIGPLALQMILAEFCHDSATPALGDIIFVLSRKQISEDVELKRLFTELEPEGFRGLCTTWSLPKNTAEFVVNAANGIGQNGELHKFIDARSYALRDLASLHRAYQRHGYELPAVFGEILHTATREPFDILPYITFEQDHSYCRDAGALTRFLKIRLELWRRLYTNPQCKSTELLYRDIVIQALMDETSMQLRDFLTLTDDDVQKMIQEKVGFVHNNYVNRRGEWPTIDFFSSWSAATEAEADLYRRGTIGLLCSQLSDQKPDAKTKRHLVKNAEGRLVSLKEAYPEAAAEIESLGTPIHPHFCMIRYPWRRDDFSPPMLKAYHATRARRQQEPEIYPDHL